MSCRVLHDRLRRFTPLRFVEPKSSNSIAMHGLVHNIIKSLILAKFDEKTWKKICSLAKMPTEFDDRTPYDDTDVYKLVVASAAVLDQTEDNVLEATGYW